MFRNFDNTSHLPLRHPANTNLHLYYDDTFEGFRLMRDKGPFIQEYLSRLKHTVELALAQYPRVMAFRVDLHLPGDLDPSDCADTNKIISRFIESFNAKIQYHRSQLREQKKDARDCKVRYVWAREVGWARKPHYHLVFFLNRDAYYSVGKLQSLNRNMISRLQEAWASALRLPVWLVEELVHIPDNTTYRIDRVPRERKVAGSDRKVLVDELPELFYRVSYLCKVATKSYGDRQRGFDTSRG
ncbi:inovirus Gp2 family protein [Metapseudomonas furukawaii]|uniref:inovirus Gp2 family protein n=1 Tax=Metapseudomonas furukawaii TaxID=1149133 RepID=UPI00056C0141|nr:inovirus Gp2 family protein [Pseudomonas furukawaii]